MCLIKAKQIHPEGDIICYKVVQEREGGVFSSPYYSNKIWKLGKTETLKARSHPDIRDAIWGYYKVIYGGAYHSHEFLGQAISFAKMSGYSDYIPRVVLECRIPKSSKYVYRGEDGTYASQKLKPIRIVYRID